MSERRRRKPMGLRINTEQFIIHPVPMIRSTRSLRLADLRILQRLEIEHASHGAKQNGNLTCTYADFVEVRRSPGQHLGKHQATRPWRLSRSH